MSSSRAERSPKTLSPFSHTGLKRCGLGGLLSRRAVHAASRDEEDSSSVEFGTVWREEEDLLMFFSGEERPLLYRHRRKRRATGGEATEEGEANRQQAKRCAVRIQSPLQHKRFSSRVTFRIPVVRGKNLDIGSAHSRNPRCVVTRRGMARRAAEEERAWMSLLFSCSYMWGDILPYKEVKLPLN